MVCDSIRYNIGRQIKKTGNKRDLNRSISGQQNAKFNDNLISGF